MSDYATWQRIGHLHRVEKLTVAQIARGVVYPGDCVNAVVAVR